MNRRTLLIGLASAAVAPALPAASHGIRAGEGTIGAPSRIWRGHINCRCTVHLLEGYQPAFTRGGVPHIAGCTWSRIADQ